MPQQADCSFEEREYCVFLTVGRVRLQLEQNGKITVYPNDRGEPYEPEWKHVGGIEAEIDYYLDLLETGGQNLKNPPESAAATIRLVEAAYRSADMGGFRIRLN